ncbi:hypothetical protein P5673_023601 [Acropora cervicornis]|uniref:Tesmin/TSO1-like CXC domain-containing protein n=1 Tax=Acropora cervicornis TaxID=6130 RepID=A0AAD9Q546_ACRCE|nr:hypothetical protein P5673_023601 [Acropora cervicornis]
MERLLCLPIIRKLMPLHHGVLVQRIQEFLGDTATFVAPLNPSEPHLVVSSNLGEAALRCLLTEPNQQLHAGNQSCDDELRNDAIEDIDLDVELLSWLYRVAVKVHHDVKCAPTHGCIGNINQESVEDIIPRSLFILVSLLCTGSQEEENEADTDLKTRVLSICQDIVFVASKGRKLTPKHLGLGLTLHQATRSKELVQLLQSAGHSISYETVLIMDNSIANYVLVRFKENGNVFVPRNFTESTATYTRYAVDNIDINEETLSGMGTFHAPQVAAFRRKGDDKLPMDIRIIPKSARRLDLEVPQLHELSQISLENKKPEPVLEEPVEEGWYKPIQEKIDESYEKELAWILGLLVHQQPELQKIPGWSGFSQLLSSNQHQVKMVGLLPIVNAPAHEYETLWTVILRCKAMTRLRNGKYTVITMDEGLYNKAKMLQWPKTEEFKNVIVVLGGFHTQMTFSKVIGKYLESSEISDIWAESEVNRILGKMTHTRCAEQYGKRLQSSLGETTAENILKGKLWNRVMRAHKLSYEALGRVLWPILTSWAKDNGKDDALADLSTRLASHFDKNSGMDTAACTRCSSMETKNAFNQIADDQALEHVNKSGKVTGGLVGITRTESARDRWCLTYNERAKLSEDTKEMFGIGTAKDDVGHKDLGKARVQRDEEDVQRLMSHFRRYDVFRKTENLVVVTTGDVASDEIKQDLLGAEEIGKTIVNEFDQVRLIKKEVKFHDSLKQQKLKTFETLYSVPVSLDKDKTVAIKADRDLLRRVVVALESGRVVDVDTLLQRELPPVPLSIATLDGCLRLASSKSDLGNILQKNVNQSQPPISHHKTYTIIDDMAAVQSLGNTKGAKSFGDWSDNFTAFVVSHFSDKCTRVDVVFDRYLPNSIKGVTRAKRKTGKSKGIRRDVASREQRIGNWDRFIVVEENKANLAHFLSTEISQRYGTHPGRELVVSGGFREILKVWSSDASRESLQELSSDHEEADTRIVLHARNAAVRGYRQLYNHGTDGVDINEERAAAFRKVKKNLDSLPPTKDALHLHIRRANFQCMIWKKAKEPRPSLSSPEENGWFYKEGVLKPKLMNQEEVSASCLQLAFCGCSSGNSCINRRCTCVRMSLGCSKGCKCGDACRNTRNISLDEEEV